MLWPCLRGATLNQLGRPIVAMVQPSKASVRHDRTASCGGSSAGRCLLRKAKMRAVFMVVADVFREQPLQMAFIETEFQTESRSATMVFFENKENSRKISKGLLGKGTQMPSPSPDPLSY